MFPNALIYKFHRLLPNPLLDIQTPLEVVPERSTGWQCGMVSYRPCPEAIPDISNITIPMFSPWPQCLRLGHFLRASGSLLTKDNPFTALHESGNIPLLTFHWSECVNHTGSYSVFIWTGRCQQSSSPHKMYGTEKSITLKILPVNWSAQKGMHLFTGKALGNCYSSIYIYFHGL